jgi:hypothetical protein
MYVHYFSLRPETDILYLSIDTMLWLQKVVSAVSLNKNSFLSRISENS